ncbi:MAG TPA: PHP domain-containing protein [Syntrophales bacterium]|nr:PHP domain-containing protein [Syntrophales bacterium]HOM07553.1 PHP domain-containing protein [Syntrophales bacterium]HOO00095.1 PHP domain-containing protein [Syntrophales bacterium]
MEFDLHIHTNRYSGCSNLDADLLVRRAVEVGLDGVVLTEHGILWPEEKLRPLAEAGAEAGLLVLAGQEVACFSPSGVFEGEFLVFGYPRSLGSSRAVASVLEMVHAVGGVVIAAHPFKRAAADPGGFYGAGMGVYDYGIDGLEVIHPSYDEEGLALARRAAEDLGVAGVGGSDAHDLAGVGACRTLFFDTIAAMEDLCRAVRERRVAAVAARGRGGPAGKGGPRGRRGGVGA